jgi:hypothetical protein
MGKPGRFRRLIRQPSRARYFFRFLSIPFGTFSNTLGGFEHTLAKEIFQNGGEKTQNVS